MSPVKVDLAEPSYLKVAKEDRVFPYRNGGIGSSLTMLRACPGFGWYCKVPKEIKEIWLKWDHERQLGVTYDYDAPSLDEIHETQISFSSLLFDLRQMAYFVANYAVDIVIPLPPVQAARRVIPQLVVNFAFNLIRDNSLHARVIFLGIVYLEKYIKSLKEPLDNQWELLYIKLSIALKLAYHILMDSALPMRHWKSGNIKASDLIRERDLWLHQVDWRLHLDTETVRATDEIEQEWIWRSRMGGSVVSNELYQLMGKNRHSAGYDAR